MLTRIDQAAASIDVARISQKAGRVAYYTLLVLMTLIVAAMFFRVSRFNGYRRVYVVDMLYGRAWKPFVYRTLLPTTVRMISAAVPMNVKQNLSLTVGGNPVVERVFHTLGWEREYLTEYAILAGLIYLSLWGFVFAIRYWFTGLFRAPPVLTNLAPLLALAGLPPIFNYTYIYDFTTLFLFTLGLGLMVREKWRAYLVLFFFACVNKETTILLTFLFVIHLFFQTQYPRSRFYRLLFAQIAIFLVVKVTLTVIFAGNPGSMVEFHLVDHNIPLFYGLLRHYSFEILFLGLGFLLLFFYRWHEQPVFLRNALWILLPLLGLNLFLGFFEELRAYYEIYPVITLLITHNVGKILGFPIQPRQVFGLTSQP